MPWCGTRKAVLRCRQRVPTGAEPREDDWDAATNCPARRKPAVGTGEEDRPLAGRLPGGQLRSLQVKLQLSEKGLASVHRGLFGKFPKRMLRVQIVDTPFRSETGGIRGFSESRPFS